MPAVPVHAAFASRDAAHPGAESYSLLLNPAGAGYAQAALHSVQLHVAPVTSFYKATRQLRYGAEAHSIMPAPQEHDVQSLTVARWPSVLYIDQGCCLRMHAGKQCLLHMPRKLCV